MKCSCTGFAYGRQRTLRSGVRRSQILAVGSFGADPPTWLPPCGGLVAHLRFSGATLAKRHKPSGLVNLRRNDLSLIMLYAHCENPLK
jgi:hypothetical protein